LRLAGRGSRRTWRPGGGAATDRPPAPCHALRRALPFARLCLVGGGKKTTLRESWVHEVLNEVYLQNLFTDECNFARRI
jgi:hypothetical protein